MTQQPDWLRESFQKLADDCPTLKAGIVHCSKCLTERKIDAVECMLHGWPECHGETMSLGIAGEVEPIRMRPDFQEEPDIVTDTTQGMKNIIHDDVVTEPSSNTREEGKRRASSFAAMGDRMKKGPGYEDWRTRESGEDSRKYLDETEDEQ